MSKLATIKSKYIISEGTDFLPVMLSADELDEVAHKAVALWQNVACTRVIVGR